MRKSRIWRGLTAILACMLAIALSMTSLLNAWAGLVNNALSITAPTKEANGDTLYYDCGYELSANGLAQLIADSDVHDTVTMEEGIVLLKNDDAALPLSSAERSVTLFGRSVADPVYKGNSGGPSLVNDRTVDLYTALSDKGFEINDVLYNAYLNSSTKRIRGSVDSADPVLASIGEEPSSFYTDALQNSYANEYNDVAIVMFSRVSGEGNDMNKVDADGISQLALHPQEANLLKMIKESGKFSKTIVLINSANAMELDWINDEQYGVDAALWIGGPGMIGFRGVANVLAGDADPSGRLVDTWAANSFSAPATQNSEAQNFTNDGLEATYIVFAEGIYTGYKYYETRYQDQVLGINNADSTAGAFASENGWNYAEEVCYTFGYGLSYADFTEDVKSIEWDRDTRTVTAVVEVTNVGVSAGSSYTGKSKDVVELYVQLPYSEGNAEKSAIQLIGFGKTKALAAGESDTVTITVSDYLFATYDEKAENGADTSKNGCYVFDSGDYYFSIGDDAHDALNNVLAARGISGMFNASGAIVDGDLSKTVRVTLEATDNRTYATSPWVDEIVSNKYDDIDINSYYDGDVVTYLTRNDWNTFPVAIENLTATDGMMVQYADTSFVTPSDAPSFDSLKQGEDLTIQLIEMKDVPYSGKYIDNNGVERDADDIWNEFLNQLTIKQLSMIPGDNMGQGAIKSIGKTANSSADGPDGSINNYIYGDKSGATVHVNEIVAASTWNIDILSERGKFLACDCMFAGVNILWGPGGNIHRTPFSGRNFEYYSEDSILSYLCAASQIKAMQEYGLTACMKHLAGNDQESDRSHVCNFMTEQAWRQGDLKVFEGALAEGNGLGAMLSYTALGMHSGNFNTNKTTLTDVIRGEWGYSGHFVTDASAGQTDPDTVINWLVSGVDVYCMNPSASEVINNYLSSNKNGYVLQRLREANKNFYYGLVHTNFINGLSVDVEVEDFVPWWQTALTVFNIALGVLAVGSLTMFVYSNYFRKCGGEKKK